MRVEVFIFLDEITSDRSSSVDARRPGTNTFQGEAHPIGDVIFHRIHRRPVPTIEINLLDAHQCHSGSHSKALAKPRTRRDGAKLRFSSANDDSPQSVEHDVERLLLTRDESLKLVSGRKTIWQRVDG
jgi:hypothetical protein